MTNKADQDLIITRTIAAPRAAVWQAWSIPENLEKWWCPKPWTTEVRGFDLRPGGAFHTIMRGPNGEEHDNAGAFLHVVPREMVVFTSVLAEGWRPVVTFLPMTAIITMEDEGSGTRYTARVLHKDEADRERHREMGFEEGWGKCIEQLGEFAAQFV